MIGKTLKRFYKTVDVQAQNVGFAVVLDGKIVRTPMNAELIVPTKQLAVAVAEEWENQGETVVLDTMVMSGFVNTTLDLVRHRRVQVIDEITVYAETDLLCYLAEEPKELVEEQKLKWQPQLDWFADTFGVRLITSTGIMHVAQDPNSLKVVREIVDTRNVFSLTGLHVLTTGTGSIVLGLAVAEGALDASSASDLGQLDALYQSSLWGQDTFSLDVRDTVTRELMGAERYINLLAADV